MGEIVKINDQNLLNTLVRFPPEILRDDTARVFFLSAGVVKHFFGSDWFELHVSPENPEPSFLRIIPGRKETAQLSAFKIVDFAELLINLQNITGFDNCIEQMRRGSIESAYAELDFGRMLYSAGAMFRFIVPQKKKGADYDVEITLPDGIVVCADAKCKIETTNFSPETIRNTLKDARNQFPKNLPSAIFVKVPARWFEELDSARELLNVARQFLGGSTKRVVSIKFYASHYVWRDGMLTQSHGFRELSNPNNRFDPNRNWDMFAKLNPTADWNGMPLRWKRLIYFPNDGPTNAL